MNKSESVAEQLGTQIKHSLESDRDRARVAIDNLQEALVEVGRMLDCKKMSASATDRLCEASRSLDRFAAKIFDQELRLAALERAMTYEAVAEKAAAEKAYRALGEGAKG